MKQEASFLLLRDLRVVATLHPGLDAVLPDDLADLWEACERDPAAFAAELPDPFSLVEVKGTLPGEETLEGGEQALERRWFYLFHNGEVVGLLDAFFSEGEFAFLLNEHHSLARMPEPLAALWRSQNGDLSAFLQVLENDERRYNYMEALPDESEEAIAAEFASDRAEIALHWERGLAMRDRYLFLRALRELEVAAALCDKYAMVNLLAELCNEMGNILIAFEDYDAAVEVMEEGLAYESSDVVCHIRLLTNLSQAYELAGKRKKALDTIETALRNIPENIYDSLLAGLYSQAASLYNHDGNYERAIQLFKLASYLADNSSTVSVPERAMFHNNLGMAYLEHGDRQLALEQLRQAVDLQPDESVYQENLARCRHEEE
ncbi:MAG: tetratricopeptide repeat protein [Candidatus Sericytochromatia bacterium]|nr:tetratricopeptide repeat protein [Candidatus Sericytochromatia bacterium]